MNNAIIKAPHVPLLRANGPDISRTSLNSLIISPPGKKLNQNQLNQTQLNPNF